jgi:hypothetical protein
MFNPIKDIKIYDNGGATFDRFTVVFMNTLNPINKLYDALAMNETPFHPMGFYQWDMAKCGRHLGKLIKFEQLPLDCQKVITEFFKVI